MELKFKYGDEVKVISGFYKGLEGTIDNFVIEEVSVGEQVVEYYVSITMPMGFLQRYVSEEELELLKEE